MIEFVALTTFATYQSMPPYAAESSSSVGPCSSAPSPQPNAAEPSAASASVPPRSGSVAPRAPTTTPATTTSAEITPRGRQTSGGTAAAITTKRPSGYASSRDCPLERPPAEYEAAPTDEPDERREREAQRRVQRDGEEDGGAHGAA